jgi:hypothetical protein
MTNGYLRMAMEVRKEVQMELGFLLATMRKYMITWFLRLVKAYSIFIFYMKLIVLDKFTF